MITIYGADWCEDTQRSRRRLRRLGVLARYVNVDEHPEALEIAKRLNNGKRRTPTIDLEGEVLVEPSNEELTTAVVRHGLVSSEDVWERLQVQNVGDLERGIRVGLGASILGGSFARCTAPGARWPLRVAAGFLLATGITGWCPGYAARGVSSLDGVGDRPREAERRGWLNEVSRPDPAQASTGAAASSPSL